MRNLLPRHHALLRALVDHYQTTRGTSTDFLFMQEIGGSSLLDADTMQTVEYQGEPTALDFERLAAADLIGFIPVGYGQYSIQLTHDAIEAVKHNFASETESQLQNIIISGDLRGAIVNLNSSLTSVTQIVNESPIINERDKEQLTELVTALKNEVKLLSPDHYEQAETIVEYTERAASQLKKQSPNRRILQLDLEGLEKAASTVEKIAPAIFRTAIAIVTLLQPYLQP